MINSPNNKNKKITSAWHLVFLLVTIFAFAFAGQAMAATQWVSDPGTCSINDPTNFPGQNCSPVRICGDSSGIAQCYDTTTLLPPAVSATSNTLYSASYPNGGYLTNCYATKDSAAPYCDNNQAFWCNRSTTCYTTQARDTVCTANTWNTSTCGSCRTGFGDCNGDAGVCEIQYGTTNYPTGANNNYLNCTTAQCDTGYLDCDAGGIDVGNGCEIQNGSTCTLGGLTGTWNGCTCTVAKQYFETGTEAQYATTDPLLWGVQFGVGDLIHFGNSTDPDLFVVENDGSVNLATITAPGVTTNKLYNIAGSLYWNGVMIGAGASGDGWGLTGNAGTDPLTNFIGTTDVQPLIFKTDSTERLRIDDAGSFGFNTDNPVSTYDFYGPEYTSLMLHNPAPSNQAVAMILDGSAGSSATYRIAGSDYGRVVSEDPTPGDHQFFVNAMNNADLNFGVASNPSVMMIDNLTENIGIGTATPLYKFDVNSGNDGVISRFVNSDEGFLFGADLYGGEAGLYNASTQELIAGQRMGNDSLVMLGQDVMYIDQTTKNVGIGTDIPAPYKLNVAGNGFFGISEDANAFVIHNDPSANNQIRVDGENNNVILSESSGFVGIGNPAPTAQLEITDNNNTNFEPLLLLSHGGVGESVGLVPVGANPDGVVTAPRGSLAMDYANGALYINRDGVTDWQSLMVGTSVWDGDTDTGIDVEQSADEDFIRMSTAGEERFRIDSDGHFRVGSGSGGSNALFEVGAGSEPATFAVQAVPGYLNIATFRDEDGENIFRAKGSLNAGDLNVTFGDTDAAYSGGGMEIVVDNVDNYMEIQKMSLRFSESSSLFADYVGFRAPATIASSVIWTLPATDGSDGQVLSTDGSGVLSWTNGGSGGAAITQINFTAATSTGSFSAGGFVGYEAANYMCDAEYAGSHFCRTDEILQYVQTEGSSAFTGNNSWIAEGPPGYTSNSNDCKGWTDNSAAFLGAFWEFVTPGGGMGWLINCTEIKPLACCS